MDVGVRELKQKLSEYLEKVAAGQIVRVTDRGQAKALLSPIPGTASLERGIAEGWIRAGKAGAVRAIKRHKAKRRIVDALHEDRD